MARKEQQVKGWKRWQKGRETERGCGERKKRKTVEKRMIGRWR